MNKSYIYLLLLVVVFAQKADEVTEAYFMSAHGISRQRQVHDALDKIQNRIAVQKTTYAKSGVSYTIDNVTIASSFIDSKQKIQIVGNDLVEVSGGRIQFEYTFNYTRVETGKSITGYATGTVVSDSLNYTKMLDFGADGHLIWQLTPGNKSFVPLTITNPLKVRRMDPFNQADLAAIEDILGNAQSGVNPSNVKTQILAKFNSVMPQTLNTTLNTYILGPQINYSFHHTSKGQLNMTIIHGLFDFNITVEKGYKVRFLTEIKDWPQPICQGQTAPQDHLSWEYYGGSQHIHMTCLYQQVVEFMQKKGWLDARLDSNWDCNAFQFYAGDLYEMINNLYINVFPREALTGDCVASPNNLVIKHGRETARNVLQLAVTYKCTAKTRSKTVAYIDVLNFTAEVKFSIKPQAEKISLDFSIVEAQVINMQFYPINNYYVTNINLALFKANEVLRKLRGIKVFGSGFPSLPRELPATEVTDDYTIFYDNSQKGKNMAYSME